MPTEPSRTPIDPADRNPAVPTSPVPDPLDVLRLSRKPQGGDDLAIFGLTRTNAEPRRGTPRMI